VTTNWSPQDDLAAGRELDARVARDVMGWQRDTPDSIWWRVGERLIEAPPFSTDIGAAWQMVEHMRRRRRFVQITCPVGDEIAVDIEGPNGETLESSWAESAPLAICRAALKTAADRAMPRP